MLIFTPLKVSGYLSDVPVDVDSIKHMIQACSARTSAAAPSAETRRTAYGVFLLVTGILITAFHIYPVDFDAWAAAMTAPMAFLVLVGVLGTAVSRRQDEHDSFIDHTLPAFVMALVLAGPQVSFVLALALGAFVMWPQRASLGGPIIVLNIGILAISNASIIFVYEATAGLDLLPRIVVTMMTSTLCSLLISGTLQVVEGTSPRQAIVTCVGMLPLDVLLSISLGAAVIASQQNPVFVLSLAVPVLLQRYSEYVQRRLASAEHTLQRDDLTGVYNRRYFWTRLDEVFEEWNGRSGLAVLMIDIDNFKLLNDRYGHLEGDEVLRGCAQAMQSAAPDNAVVARYGGEEFGVIMPEGTYDSILALAESLRVQAREALAPWGTSVSIGVAFAMKGDAPRSVTDRADQALYEAKLSGKDRWVLASADPEEPALRAVA